MFEPVVPAGILLAETDPNVAESLVALLKGQGYQVEPVADSSALLRAVQARSYAVIVLDLGLTGASGLETVRKIRHVPHPYGDAPVLVLVPDLRELDESCCRDAGVDGTVAKPIDPHAFLEMVTQWVEAVEDPQWGLEPRPGVPPAVISRRALSQLADDVGVDLLPEILETFLFEARRRVALLKEATEARDTRAAGEAAHALKGSAGTFGAMALRQAAYRMERAGRDNDLERLVVLMPEVSRLLDETLAVLGDTADP